MPQINVEVNFNNSRKTHSSLVSELSDAFQAQEGDTVDFQIHFDNNSRVVYSDLLILLTSAVSYLRQKGIQVTGVIHCNDTNDNKIKYASRVNFFRILDLDFPENFIRRSANDRFTEIEFYDKDSIHTVFENLIKVIIANISTQINLEVRQMLYFCIYEIMDNVVNHSKLPFVYEGNGWCCAQLFPAKKEIRFMICDVGVGIHEALTKPEKSKHRNLTEEEALNKCTERGVTNGEGLGFGLFATLEFIKENKGEMIVYSGNTYVHIVNGVKNICQGNYWHGTFVYLRINTDIAVDYKQLMPPTSTLPDDYAHYTNEKLGISEDLW